VEFFAEVIDTDAGRFSGVSGKDGFFIGVEGSEGKLKGTHFFGKFRTILRGGFVFFFPVIPQSVSEVG